MIHFKKWISASDIDSYKECPNFTEFHEDALIRELVHNKYIICGDTHQSEDFNCVPLFSDGYLLLSMRRWAEIMEDAYVYMGPYNHRDHCFYMACVCDLKEELPSCDQ